jgi:hypothetical protein
METLKKLAQKESARCKHCPRQISCKWSNITELARHLERVHDIYIDKKTVEKFTNAKCLNRAKRIRICQPSILNFVKKQSLLEIVARLVAKDSFSIRGITGSNSIREYIAQKGFILSMNQSDTMALIFKFYEE